ncbi:hypothetical protein [Demequina lignilytica]|uniref:Membrane protein involved in the export of O-antigen and teichoic acid n=1 Tax=Demequina lignilytica TaxID=3051663 RepID=A0AB35MKM2_9MICO|nr:hypothetical protein [Demequina sp. SYSU T0a273]MDN4484165.1 hypothetical protein [Demequina sp. SYSU T0a273]
MTRVFYFLNPVVIGLSSLVLIPALIVAADAHGWAQIAVGQSIGAFGAVLVSLGWGISGPALVANASDDARLAEYEASLRARLLAFAVVAPAVAAVAAVLTSGGALAPAVAAVATCAIGLGPSWFYVGTADPRRWFVRDTVPRAAANLLAAAVAVGLGWVVAALAVQGLGILVGIALSSRAFRASVPGGVVRPRWGAAARRIGPQAPVVIASSVTMLYAAAPVAIVNQVAPALTPSFALLDRMHKQAQSGLSPIVQISQHHVARGDAAGIPRRALRAGLRAIAALVVIGAVYAALAPLAVEILGAGRLSITPAVAILSGVVIVVQVVEQFSAKALLATVGRTRVIAASNITGAAVGLGLLVPLTHAGGLVGVLGAIIAGYVVTIGIDGAAFVRTVRGSSHRQDVAA